MGKKTSSIWSLGEPLFLGLSCVVGGEQFYILLYGTGRSVRGQSFVLVTTAIITCIMSAAVSSRTDILTHLFHLFYMSVLILLMAISNEITSRGIVTTSIIALGYGLTVLVIQSCSLYSSSREELLSFILGIFSARYLPCFLRLFVDKGCTCDSKIKNLSMALGISRLVFCIISLVLKVVMGRFELSIIGSNIILKDNRNDKSFWERLSCDMTDLFTKHWSDFHNKSLLNGFTEIWDHKKYFVENKVDDNIEEFYKKYLTPIFKFLPIVMFLNSILISLMYPKTRFSAYCSYSPKVISTLMNVKFVSHIIGSLVGIKYPVSVTSNSALFPTITFFFYYLLVHYFLLPHWDRYFTKPSLYVIVGASSFILGYMSSYSLGLIINMVFMETCTYEEVETFDKTKFFKEGGGIKMKWSCCGDKITSKCYCKLEQIVGLLDKYHLDKLFLCSKLFFNYNCNRKLRFEYSKDGKYAILLIYDGEGTDCCKESEDCCTEACKGNCCLKIIGKYKIDAVTLSSCEECQLTIRLEGTCCNSQECPKCCNNGQQCECKSQDGKCCCICVKCCGPTCSNGKCCCIHFCKKDSGSCNCQCQTNSQNNKELKEARVFICYKTSGSKCCIKEIRPNDKADFIGDLKRKDVFDIDHIFISDCCHADVKVDLKCTVKNNYFRLGGANYPRKFQNPEVVRLLWNESMCCPTTGTTQCCCMFSSLVRAYIMFIGSSMELGKTKGCVAKCSCNGDPTCCLKVCDLIVHDRGGFMKRLDRLRVKLVVISWLFFGLVFFSVVLLASMFRSKYSPQTFYPMTSYSKLVGRFASNKYNSNDQVTARIVGLSIKGQISSQTVEAKKVEMKAMLSMFDKYTKSQETKKTKKKKPKEVEKIHKYITSQATSFSPSSSIGGRACELCVVQWSQCVGLVYKYAMPLFFFVQKFFIAWEKAWKIDFYNYKKQMIPYVTKVTYNSNISLSKVMSGVKVGDKSNQMGLDRLMTWNGGFKETKQLSQGKMEEDNMRTESIPPKIGNRLCYYVRRWNHRLDNIRNWCKFESHLFDWAKFLHEYYKIREWVTDVSPGLRCDSEVKVSTKDLNKGIKIFIATI